VGASSRAEVAPARHVRGQVFFACAVQFANSFDYVHAPERVVIDLTDAHFWDTTAVAALDRVVLKLRRHGAGVEVIGLNRASQSLVDRLGTHGEPAAR
jgi:SulP family sulfate permease